MPTLLLMGGRRSRRRSAVDVVQQSVVVVAPTCYENLCWIHISGMSCQVVDFSTSNHAVWDQEPHTQQHRVPCTKGSRVKPTQAERTATLTLVSWVLLLLLLLLLLYCGRRTAAVDFGRVRMIHQSKDSQSWWHLFP